MHGVVISWNGIPQERNEWLPSADGLRMRTTRPPSNGALARPHSVSCGACGLATPGYREGRSMAMGMLIMELFLTMSSDTDL